MKCIFSNYEIINIRKMDEQFIKNLINSDDYFSFDLLFQTKFENYDNLVKSKLLFTIKELKSNELIGFFTYTDKKILYIIIDKKNKKHFTLILKNLIIFIFEKLKENTIYIFNSTKNDYLNNLFIKNYFKYDSKKSIMENYIMKEYNFYYFTKQMFNTKQIYPVITFKDDISLNHIVINAFIDNKSVGLLNSTIHNNDVVIDSINTTNEFYDQIIKDLLLKKCYQIISEYNYYCLHFNNYYIESYTSNDLKNVVIDLNDLFCKQDDKKLLMNNIFNNKYLYTFVEVLSVNNINYNLLSEYKLIKRKQEYSTFIVTNNSNITKIEYFIQDNFLVIKPIDLLTNEILSQIKYLEEKTNCLYTIIYTYNNKTNLKHKYKNQVLM